MLQRLAHFSVRQTVGIGTGPSAIFLSRRPFNTHRSVQTRYQMEAQSVANNRSEYDFDKERWAKQMKLSSMDCIMNPDIVPARYTTWTGLRKAFYSFITMKKLIERRPDFDEAQLKSLFIQLKVTSHERNNSSIKALQRLTTHSEAARIAKEIASRLNEDFAKKSWKSLKQQDVANTYEIEIDSFSLVTCYMGQMTNDDWLQITYRCEYRERERSDLDWVNVVEYPVFEVRLTDGVSSPNNYPFIVVGVLRKDGTRYGQDAQDAASLRKQFDRSRRWF